MARKKTEAFPDDPRTLGRLGTIAFALAAQTADELQRTGSIRELRMARTRMHLAIGAAEPFVKWINREVRRRNKASRQAIARGF